MFQTELGPAVSSSLPHFALREMRNKASLSALGNYKDLWVGDPWYPVLAQTRKGVYFVATCGVLGR